MVIRILHQDAQMLQYWNLEVAEINRFFRGRGLYLFAGPVGSGKTSLMHEMAKKIFVGCQQMSIEDPVELRQEQMLQLQLNEAIGMTYDRLIKLSLRHRPDLLIIGEIRDKETARAVLRASLTGVTVFSTIHAGSVPGAYQRFIELGVTEEEAAHILKGVCYQRMIQGKGVVDFASEKFTQHGPEYWNQTLDALVEQGVVSEREAREEKIKPSQTA